MASNMSNKGTLIEKGNLRFLIIDCVRVGYGTERARPRLRVVHWLAD